jgi:transposase
LEITFTKTGARSYEVVARRDDKVVVRVQTADRPQGLPHDMAHYLVERGLGFERGFWGAVAAGAVFKGMQVVSGRRSPHRSNRTRPATQDGRALRRYRRRWKVERLNAWLQNFRRIATRFDYHAENYLGFVHLGCIKILLRCYL